MKEDLKKLIRDAFKEVEYSGDWCLTGSNEGTEPTLLEQEFKGKTDWKTLDSTFLDQAPNGYGSALSFFLTKHSDFIFQPIYVLTLIANWNKQM